MLFGSPKPDQPYPPASRRHEHDAPRPPKPAPSPAQAQTRQIVWLGIVVVVLLTIIYLAAGGQFHQAEFISRFNFFGVPHIHRQQQKQVDLRAMVQNTPRMMAAGKQVFEVNCVPCHGEDGLGNGPRSAGLNPPPRNFHDPTSKFTNGTSLVTLYHTISNGVSGTSMPAWAGVLNAAQRMEVAHYVQHWIPDPQQDTPAEVASLPTGASSAAPVGPTPLPKVKAVDEGPHIPIDLAMKDLVQLYQQAAQSDPPPPQVADNAAGAAIYQADCASCHLPSGQGGKPIWMISFDPYVEVKAQSFDHPLMPQWTSNETYFSQLVAHGLPGRMMPGFGALTQAQMTALYAHVQHLAGQLGAAPAASQASQK